MFHIRNLFGSMSNICRGKGRVPYCKVYTQALNEGFSKGYTQRQTDGRFVRLDELEAEYAHGYNDGTDDAYDLGYEAGMEDGQDRGYDLGYKEGINVD